MSKKTYKWIKKIKNVCTLLRNSFFAKKEYVYIKDLSSLISDFLYFLKRNGLILSFKLEKKNYLVRLNILRKSLVFSYHSALGGRKLAKKWIALIPSFSHRMLLVYSNKFGYKILSIKESYSYEKGGIILGTIHF